MLFLDEHDFYSLGAKITPQTVSDSQSCLELYLCMGKSVLNIIKLNGFKEHSV